MQGKDMGTIFMLVICFCQDTEAAVYWKTDSRPVIFGEDVNLTCYIQRTVKECRVHQWTKGANEAVLAFQGESYNKAKYKQYTISSLSNFTLTIKKFGLSDVNVKYTCFCEFEKSTQLLEMQPDAFAHYPKNHSFHLNFKKNSEMELSLTLNDVYPIPNCSLHVTYQGQKNLKAIYLNPDYESNGQLYDVFYEFAHNVSGDICDKVPIVKCWLNTQLSPMTFERVESRNCDVKTVSTANSFTTPISVNSSNKNKSSMEWLVIVSVTIVAVGKHGFKSRKHNHWL